MTLIWKNLLHANFRCGRMYTTRAEYGTERCALPSVCANVMVKLPKR